MALNNAQYSAVPSWQGILCQDGLKQCTTFCCAFLARGLAPEWPWIMENILLYLLGKGILDVLGVAAHDLAEDKVGGRGVRFQEGHLLKLRQHAIPLLHQQIPLFLHWHDTLSKPGCTHALMTCLHHCTGQPVRACMARTHARPSTYRHKMSCVADHIHAWRLIEFTMQLMPSCSHRCSAFALADGWPCSSGFVNTCMMLSKLWKVLS